MARILVFGDSITYGAFDSEDGGWVDRLKAFFFKDGRRCNYFVYNLAVSGNTAEDLLERFEFETKQRLKEEKEAIFIFGIGINDSAFVSSENDFWVIPERFKDNIQKLINLAKKYSSKIIFVGLLPVDELKTTPIPWDTDITYKNEYIKDYDEIIKTICRENNLYFIEIFEKFIKSDYKKLLEDGCHPNTEGHKKIFEIVKNFLIENEVI